MKRSTTLENQVYLKQSE